MSRIEVTDLTATGYDVQRTPEAGVAYMKKLHAEWIMPNAETIAEGWARDRIMVMVRGEVADRVKPMAIMVGWKHGGPSVFEMTAEGRRNFHDLMVRIGDRACAEWLARKGADRLLLIEGDTGGNLLINFAVGDGWSLEPGTLDTERQS